MSEQLTINEIGSIISILFLGFLLLSFILYYFFLNRPSVLNKIQYKISKLDRHDKISLFNKMKSELEPSSF